MAEIHADHAENAARDGRLLLASIHDISPRFESQIDQLIGVFENNLSHRRFAMLVVPDHWGESPLIPGSPFATKLRGWAEQGIEMFVHGWFHQDRADHSGAASFKARHMTAGEGEFLGLSQEVAAQRMTDGRTLIEDIIGTPTAGFIAPAWLYGEGAHAALKDSAFPLVEDHMRVWKPQTGEQLARGPVITWASRSTARTASSLAFAALARVALQPLDVVRLAVHPGDTTKQSILDSIARTLTAFKTRREAGHYSWLLQDRA